MLPVFGCNEKFWGTDVSLNMCAWEKFPEADMLIKVCMSFTV